MKNLNVSPEELYRLVEQFVETLSDKEYFDTKKNICWMIFDDFKEWYWKEDIEMNELIKTLEEEQIRVKTWLNGNNFNCTTAPWIIAKRYRDELKQYLRTLRDNMDEDLK